MSKGKEKAKEGLERLPVVGNLLRQHSSSSTASHSSQLVDLVVEDHEAEQVERVRARKEGGPGWNSIEQRHFVQTFPGEEEQEEVRQGFNPDKPEKRITDESHALDEPFAVGDGGAKDTPTATAGVGEEEGVDELGARQPWERRRYEDDETEHDGEEGKSGPFEDEREAWGR